MKKCKKIIAAVCVHPHKEKFYGVAHKQSKSYTLLAGLYAYKIYRSGNFGI